MTNTKNVISRYSMLFNAWEIGYYQGTRFIIVSFVRM